MRIIDGNRPGMVVLFIMACVLMLLFRGMAYGANATGNLKQQSSNARKNNTQSYRYVLNLESTFTRNKKAWLPDIASLKKYTLYTTQYKHKGKLWFRLRLGFFASRRNANQALKTLKLYFPGVWVDRVSDDDLNRMVNWEKSRIKDATADKMIAEGDDEVIPELPPEIKVPIAPVKPIKIEPLAKPEVQPQMDLPLKRKGNNQVMHLAKRALSEKRYSAAAQHYLRVLSGKESKHKQEAQELLGLAYEKNGQSDQAKAEYTTYLKLYPKGEGAERVSQRLLALITARETPKPRSVDKKNDDVYWTSFGSIAQFFRHDVSEADGFSVENQSLQSDLVVSARRRSNKYDLKTFLSANHYYDVDDSDKDADSKLSSMYVELIERQGAYSGKVGRFTQNSGGVFGRMDGVLGNYGINDKWKVNAVAGYPVEIGTSNLADKNKPFYGIGLNAGTFNKRWNYNVYYYNRDVESLTDRQAMGGEIRFIGEKQTTFALLDYDTYFNKLNTLFAVGNWRLPRNSHVNLTLNYRMSPLLMTTSALQGQGTASIDTLKQTLSEEEIKQLALDRTAVYKSLTLSGSKELTDKYSVYGEVTASNLAGTPSSGGVDASLPTGNEFYYDFQLIGLNIYSKFDTTTGGIRYEDTMNYQKYKISASTRWRPKGKWTYRPKLAYEIRNNTDGSSANKITPSLRVDYRYSKKAKFEFEMGYDDVAKDDTVKSKESTYSISIGYIYDFF